MSDDECKAIEKECVELETFTETLRKRGRVNDPQEQDKANDNLG